MKDFAYKPNCLNEIYFGREVFYNAMLWVVIFVTQENNKVKLLLYKKTKTAALTAICGLDNIII